ncbi:DUF3048 domain-containing protein [Patescibacteria group bacterium]|nr:DUF3048 domain-containing protein [Patescibacteria group bacterium]
MGGNSKKYFTKKGQAILIASFFVLVVSALGLYYFVFVPDWNWLNNLSNIKDPVIKIDEGTTVIEPENEVLCEGCQRRWLDGVPVPAAEADVFPVAVMIDNDVLARPQAGLAKASLVYEVPVEGGMTRYLAIYPSNIKLEAVGPVRSARPYFVTLAADLQALYLHCGGSPESLTQIKKASLYDLNEFYNSQYFWRVNNNEREAPHNILTDSDNWQSYLEKQYLSVAEIEPWLFKTETTHADSSADISLYFSANFRALWRYNAENNNYQRFFNGLVARDETEEIYAKNIIIQYIESKVMDEVGRLAISLQGGGEALLCIDGECRAATWRKRSGERTKYYFINGEEIKLNPGITWIELADQNTRVNY